jgi:hypothetical protein
MDTFDLRPSSIARLSSIGEYLGMTEAPPVVGNRLALAGAIWYLLEIPLVFPFVSGTLPPPVKTAELIAYYSAHKSNLMIGVAVGSVVWLGRIAFFAGARASLHRTAGVRALADLGLGVMVLSVVMEVGGAALTAAAGQMAAGGGDAAGIVALDYASAALASVAIQATAVAIAATSLAQVISRQFPPWLGWLGLASGVLGIASSLFMTATALDPQRAPYLTLWILGWWIWMVATGVVLFRRTPGRLSQQPDSA